MSMTTLLTYNQHLALVCGATGNVLLLYIIRTTASLDVKAYSRLLVLHSVVDLLFVFAFTVCSIKIITTERLLFLVVSGVLSDYGTLVGRISILLYTMMVLLEITLIPIDYFYRYMLLCRNQKFTTTKFIYCFIGALGVSIFQNVIGNTCIEFGPTSDNIHYWKMITDKHPFDKLSPFAVYDPESNSKVQYNFITAVCIIVLCYSIVGYCTYQIRKTLLLNERSRVRRESRRISAQITRVMIFQALLPCVVMCAPALMICACFLIGVNVEQAGELISILIHWMPTLKPIATIYIVHPYRRAFLRKLHYSLATETTVVSSNEESSMKNTLSEPNEVYL
ncbi:unnamed protein product [Bursaphelenchus okinawaensis]|uniref:G_PROTEIN_RECEP_F1_2 domain-containing protein n=1 Tax=Bursaphelenchus okinawaensis TaxID=465554 RepID=A0A811K5W4_9BILA|nr:unnamed protein product [Bursaphelenchus okinawaensis]CAG9093400.1 unnamed protein product [Bursaphelenchus okinawaensis]